MCHEGVHARDDTRLIFNEQGVQVQAHRECLLREVMGGIGHLIAHDHWCTEKQDPDAGLTYRQSAKLVDAYVSAVGYG